MTPKKGGPERGSALGVGVITLEEIGQGVNVSLAPVLW